MATWHCLRIFSVLVAFQFVNVVDLSAESTIGLKKCKFYVILPKSDTKCPPATEHESNRCTRCETIDSYAENKGLFKCIHNCTIELIFMEGDHTLSNKSLYINKVYNLTMMPKSKGTVTIHLDKSTIELKSISLLNIEGLVFQGYNDDNTWFSDMRIEHASQMHAQLHDVELRSIATVFKVADVSDLDHGVFTVYPKVGYTLIEITESTFDSSNVQFMFETSSDDYAKEVNVSITHSKFFGQAFDICSVNVSSIALTVHNVIVDHKGPDFNFLPQFRNIYLPSCSHIRSSIYEKHDVTLEISASQNQNATAIVNISNSTFSAPAVCVDNFKSTASFGGIHITLYGHLYSASVSITDCTISAYQEGGLHMYIGTVTLTNLCIIVDSVSISECTSSSSLSHSSAMSIVGDYYLIDEIHVIVQNSRFIGNRDLHGDAITLWLYNLKQDVFIENCTFDSNFGTAIQACDTNVRFSGKVNFTRNNASQGGALKLIDSQIKITDRNTCVLIEDNYASDTGGGIYIDRKNRDIFEETKHDTNVQCVYQLLSPAMFPNHSDSEPLIVFLNNRASNGGDHVYGASLHGCCTVYVRAQDDLIVRSYSIEKSMFQLTPNNSSVEHSLVSSNPTRLCFCNPDGSQIDCATKESIYRELTVIPGEEFSVSVVMVGAYFGRTTGPVYSSISNSADVSTRSQENVNNIFKCTTLKYSISTDLVLPSSSVVMTLSTTRNRIDYGYRDDVIETDIESYHNDTSKCIPLSLLTTNIYLNITPAECPPGFSLSQETHTCECNIITTLNSNHEYECKIENGQGVMNRYGNTWVYTFTDNETSLSSIGIVNDCPFDYCSKSNSKLVLGIEDRDSQCRFNRSGILCGECNKDSSLMLGSSKCFAECNDNAYISLIIVFLILGPLLVFFIKIFDLTVQQGTVNGLIFYANVVWIYKSVFFPTADLDNEHCNWCDMIVYFLKVFIAWINLDFGIEVCFYDTLNAYVHTWLQFLFPFYIWIIVIIIIIGCKYSVRLTKLFGENSVPVLATLFLLSFVKLLRTISSVLHFTPLEHPPDNSSSALVWSIDGNIPYFWDKRHGPLFVFAVVVFLCFCIPYTFLLLFEQCLDKYVHCVPMHRLKPFYDANLGPLKDKHRYWVGLLLIVRTMLVVLYATIPTNKANLGLFVMCICTAFLVCYSALNLYKEWKLAFLESVFFANLLILGMCFLFKFSEDNEKQDKIQQGIVMLFIGISFVKFVVIFCFHSWKKIQRFGCHFMQLGRCFSRHRQQYEEVSGNNQANVPNMCTTHGSVTISQSQPHGIAGYRNSVFNSDSQ